MTLGCQVSCHPKHAWTVFILNVTNKYQKHCPNLYFWPLLAKGVHFCTETRYFGRLSNACDE